MRFNKPFFVTMLSAGLTLAPCVYPEYASNTAALAENRKLSMSVPGLGTAHVVVVPATAPGQTKPSPIQTNGNNVTVRLPSSINKAVEEGHVFTRQVGRTIAEGYKSLMQIFAAVAAYIRQWTGANTITPAGSPYINHSMTQYSSNNLGPLPATTQASGHKLYYTSEGRLKSVVNR
jgi:hypothetical protein